MEKICLIGDAHFSRKAEHPLIKKHIKDGQLAFFDSLVNELKERNIKTIYLLVTSMILVRALMWKP
jgi:hypothetical protein